MPSAAAVVLVDTGPLVALFDPSDNEHTACTRQLAVLEKRSLVTTLAVLTEATYLLSFSTRAQEALLDFVAAGAMSVMEFDRASIASARELMSKYSDLPMDFADATLVVAAQQLDTVNVFTLDRRDFSTYRLGRRKLKLLP